MLDKLIVITSPEMIKNETETWTRLFDLGLQKLHIRKPGWDKGTLLRLIEQVPVNWRKKMVIHRHPDIVREAGLGGVHLSYPNINGMYIPGYSVSYSAHNWAEMRNIIHDCDYAFISPVFTSISKKGYAQNKSLLVVPEDLKDKNIFALSGINNKNISHVFQAGYYGAALLGYLWNEPARAVSNWQQLLLNNEIKR